MIKYINGLLRFICCLLLLFNCSSQPKEDLELIFNHAPRFILSSELNPDGTQLALQNYTGEVQLWNIKTRQLIRKYQHIPPSQIAILFTVQQHLLIPAKKELLYLSLTNGHLTTLDSLLSPIISLAYHPESNTLVCGLKNGEIYLWKNLKEKEALKGSVQANDMTFLSPHHLIVATEEGEIEFWDLSKKKISSRIKAHSEPTTKIALSPDKKHLLSMTHNKEFKLWDVKAKTLIYTSQKHKAPLQTIGFTPDNRYFVTADKIRVLYFWNRQNFSIHNSIKARKELFALKKIHFIPDSEQMLLVGNGLNFWDWTKLEPIKEFESQTRFVEGVSLDNQGKYLVLGGDDFFIRIFNLKTGQLEQRLKHDHMVFSTRLDKSSTALISASHDKTIKFWEFPSGKIKATLTGHQDRVCCIALTPDQKRLVSASKDTTLKIWSYPEGQELRTLTGHTNRITSLSMSKDGKQVATGSLDKTARVWDVATGKLLRTLNVQERVNGSSFNLTNNQLFTASTAKGLQVWDLKTGKLVNTPINEYADYVEVNDDHYFVALGNGLIQQRSLKDHHIITTFKGQQQRVHDLLIRPDINRLISAGYDDKALIWNLKTGELLMTIQPVLNGGWLAYTPDSRFDASPDVLPFLHWRKGMETFPLDKFKAKKYQPGLLKEIIKGS